MDGLLCGVATPSPANSYPSSDSSTSDSSGEVVLECDYDTSPTKLYQAVEDKQWETIAFFLETGTWNNASYFSCSALCGGVEPDPPSVEARTWVTALDNDGHVRWCQLPLHAAIIFQAPLSIIQKMLHVYPRSARCADDQGLLPLHYAFRFGSPDDVLWVILQAFPQAIRKKAAKNRLPLDLAPFSSKPDRGYIIERFMESAVKAAKVVWEADHEAKQKDSSPRRRLYRKNEKLVRAMNELKQSQKQVNDLQHDLKEARNSAKAAAAVAATTAATSRVASPTAGGGADGSLSRLSTVAEVTSCETDTMSRSINVNSDEGRDMHCLMDSSTSDLASTINKNNNKVLVDDRDDAAYGDEKAIREPQQRRAVRRPSRSMADHDSYYSAPVNPPLVRSRRRTRRSAPPVAKQTIRNMFHGLNGKLQKSHQGVDV